MTIRGPNTLPNDTCLLYYCYLGNLCMNIIYMQQALNLQHLGHTQNKTRSMIIPRRLVSPHLDSSCKKSPAATLLQRQGRRHFPSWWGTPHQAQEHSSNTQCSSAPQRDAGAWIRLRNKKGLETIVEVRLVEGLVGHNSLFLCVRKKERSLLRHVIDKQRFRSPTR